MTVVNAASLAQLGLIPVYQTTTQTFAGTVRVGIFRVSLSITDLYTAAAPWFVQSDLFVMDMPASLSGIDVVIGMDVLATCKTTIDGPQQRFILEF